MLSACAALELWLFADQCIDDAFISFRYAHNLIHHGVLAYNLGERPIEGFSNPLWVLLNLPGALLGTPLLWARVLGVTCLGLHVWLLVHLSKRVGLDASWSVPLSLALCLSAPGFLYWHFAGLETPLVGLLVTASLAAFRTGESRQVRWLGPLLAALAWTRIDAALTALLVLVACMLSYGLTRARLKRAVVALGWVFAALAILQAARLAYFGQPLPNTYYAKVDGHLFDDASNGLRYALQPFGHAPLLLAGFLLPLWLWSKRAVDPIVSASCVVFLGQLVYVTAVGGDWMPLYRFLAPFVPAAALASMVALQRVFERANALGVSTALLSSVVLVIAPGGLAGYLLSDEPLTVQMATEVTELGKNLAAALTKAVAPGTVTANGAAGSAPYYARLSNIDIGGLNDPVIAHAKVSRFASFLPKGHRKGEGRYVLSRAPGVLVFVQGRSSTPGQYAADAQIAFDPRFHAHYERLELNATRAPEAAGWVLMLPEHAEGFFRFAALAAQEAWIGTNLVRQPNVRFQVFRRTKATSPARALLARVAQLSSDGSYTQAAAELEREARRTDLGQARMLVHPMLGYLYVRAGDLVRASTHLALAQRVLPAEWMDLLQLWLRTDPVFEPLVESSLAREG
jgi:hypothetical protein